MLHISCRTLINFLPSKKNKIDFQIRFELKIVHPANNFKAEMSRDKLGMMRRHHCLQQRHRFACEFDLFESRCCDGSAMYVCAQAHYVD